MKAQILLVSRIIRINSHEPIDENTIVVILSLKSVLVVSPHMFGCELKRNDLKSRNIS